MVRPCKVAERHTSGGTKLPYNADPCYASGSYNLGAVVKTDGRKNKTPARRSSPRKPENAAARPSARQQQCAACVISQTWLPSVWCDGVIIIDARSFDRGTGKPTPMSKPSVTAKPISRTPTSSHQINAIPQSIIWLLVLACRLSSRGRLLKVIATGFQAAWAEAYKLNIKNVPTGTGIQAANQHRWEDEIACGQWRFATAVGSPIAHGWRPYQPNQPASAAIRQRNTVQRARSHFSRQCGCGWPPERGAMIASSRKPRHRWYGTQSTAALRRIESLVACWIWASVASASLAYEFRQQTVTEIFLHAIELVTNGLVGRTRTQLFEQSTPSSRYECVLAMPISSFRPITGYPRNACNDTQRKGSGSQICSFPLPDQECRTIKQRLQVAFPTRLR